MSLLSAMYASRTGLMANSRRAEVVSTNIANAQDENFSRRSLSVTSEVGGGVRVLGVTRAVNTAMDGLYRDELSRASKYEAIASSLSLYTAELGDIDSDTNLPSQLVKFENALSMLSNAPGDTNLQQQVLTSAKTLAGSLNSASNALAKVGTRALQGIEADVAAANTSMKEIAKINADIARAQPGTETYAVLEDRMGQELDSLAAIMDIEVTYDGEGRAKVFTDGGQTLVFAQHVNELSYDRTSQTLYSGDENITPGIVGRRGSDDGSLAGHFELLTETLPQMQLELDEVARSLIQGFEDADTSIAVGEAGLFTDGGLAYDTTALPGLAGRIGVNAAVDPQRGGELWRLRDGVGAATEGATSDGTQLLAFVAMLQTAQSFDPAAGQGSSMRISEFTSGIFSQQQNARVEAEGTLDTLIASSEVYRSARLDARGVSIDNELQSLTLIEQAYNANSQALRVVSEMIDTLLAAV